MPGPAGQSGMPFNIGNIFRRPGPSLGNGTPMPENPNPQQQQSGGGVPPQGNGGMPNAQNPNADPLNNQNQQQNSNPQNNNVQDQNASPLDPFKDFFTIDPNATKKQDPFADKLLNMDSTKLAATVGKMDFTQGLNPELVTKALGGDMQSFSAVLNHVTRNSFAQATQMVTALTEGAISRNNSRWDTAMGDRIRSSMLEFQRPENAALSHPAAQPVLAALKKQVASQFPNLSPAEITKKAEEWFIGMADAINQGKTPAPGTSGNKKQEGDVNWEDFLNGPTAQN